jgi:hypothetical protein
MRMTFLDRGGTDLNKPRLGPEVLNGSRTTIAHAGTQASDELEDKFSQGTFVRNATLNTLGNEFLTGRRLTVDVLGS